MRNSLGTEGTEAKMKKTLRLAAIFGLALTCGTVAWAGTEKLSTELKPENRSGSRSAQDADLVEVIVQYKVAPTEAHHRRIAGLGGKLNTRMDFIKAAHYSVPASALDELANDPDIAYISPNRTVLAHVDQAQAAIGASAAKTYGLTGAGVGVVVMDSGVGYSQDLAGKVVYEQVFLPNTPEGDNFGHGSHVAGIIAGSGSLSTTNKYTTFTRTFNGVAQGVNLLDFQVLSSTGAGTDSAVIAALDQAIAFKKAGKYNIRVINLSLGRPVFESYKLDPLCQAAEQAWKAGIVVVAAAGNFGRNNPTTTFGYGTITAPGNDPLVITVGAMKDMGTTTPTDDLIASYSSKGPTLYDMVAKPDLVAPGNLIDAVQSQSNNIFGANPQVGYRPEPLRRHGRQRGFQRLHAIERNQHGHALRQRGGGAADPAELLADAGSGESAADADGGQEYFSRHQQLQRPGNRYHVLGAVRHFHRRRGLSEHRQRPGEHRSGDGGGQRRFPGSGLYVRRNDGVRQRDERRVGRQCGMGRQRGVGRKRCVGRQRGVGRECGVGRQQPVP